MILKRIYSTSPRLPWKVLFFGSDKFALTHLIGLNNMMIEHPSLVKEVNVVSVNDKTRVSYYAAESHLKQLSWPPSIRENEYDIGVVVSFGHLIPSKIISAFPHGIINVHPSLLPRWRGASPIIYTIKNGDKVTGVTVTEIKPKHFDVGPILLQEKCVVPENCHSSQLGRQLADIGVKLLEKTLADLTTLKKHSREQEDVGTIYAPKICSSLAFVNWEHTQEKLWRQYRAIGEMFHLSCGWRGMHLKLIDMLSPDEMRQLKLTDDIQTELGGREVPVGYAFYHKWRELLCIKCKDNWVTFRSIIIKKTMPAKEFYNGYISKQEVVFKTLTKNSKKT